MAIQILICRVLLPGFIQSSKQQPYVSECIDLEAILYTHTHTHRVDPQLSNNSQIKQFGVWPKNLSKKCFSNRTSWANENGTRRNDCRSKPNTAELITEFTRAVLFHFSNKSVVEHNFGTNYVLRPNFHYIYIYIYIIILLFSRFNGPFVIRGSLNKFPDFFRMGTFIDSTHMKL